MVQFMTDGEEEDRLYMPPPWFVAMLPDTTQLVSTGEEANKHDIPPPDWLMFPDSVEFLIVGEQYDQHTIPPPKYMLALSATVQSRMVGEE